MLPCLSACDLVCNEACGYNTMRQKKDVNYRETDYEIEIGSDSDHYRSGDCVVCILVWKIKAG